MEIMYDKLKVSFVKKPLLLCGACKKGVVRTRQSLVLWSCKIFFCGGEHIFFSALPLLIRY